VIATGISSLGFAISVVGHSWIAAYCLVALARAQGTQRHQRNRARKKPNRTVRQREIGSSRVTAAKCANPQVDVVLEIGCRVSWWTCGGAVRVRKGEAVINRGIAAKREVRKRCAAGPAPGAVVAEFPIPTLCGERVVVGILAVSLAKQECPAGAIGDLG